MYLFYAHTWYHLCSPIPPLDVDFVCFLFALSPLAAPSLPAVFDIEGPDAVVPDGRRFARGTIGGLPPEVFCGRPRIYSISVEVKYFRLRGHVVVYPNPP